MSEYDRVEAALSRAAAARKSARSSAQEPSTPRQSIPESRSRPPVRDTRCSIQYDNGHGVLSLRLLAELDGKSKSQQARSSSTGLDKPLPKTPEMGTAPSDCEPFTLADVPAMRVQTGRAAYVQSVAVSTHSGTPSMPPPSHARHASAEHAVLSPTNTHTRNISNASHRPTHTRDPSLANIYQPSLAHVPTNQAPTYPPNHTHTTSTTSNISAPSRTYSTATLAQHLYPVTSHPNTSHPNTSHPNTSHPNTSHPNTSHPNTSHPNTSHPFTILLYTHLPQYRFLSLTPSLLSALETATVPTLPSTPTTSSSTTPTHWYTSWPLHPHAPLPTRTLHTLRTTNSTALTIQKSARPNPLRSGQGSHLATVQPCRWTLRTMKHGMPTDYRHPGYGAVGASRALWLKCYRDEAYCGGGVGEVEELRGGRGKRKASVWEGHWLRRGLVRGLRLGRERARVVVRDEEEDDEGEEEEEEEWEGDEGAEEMERGKGRWRQDVDVGVEKLKRMGSAIGGVAKMASKWGKGKKEKGNGAEVQGKGKGKKTYRPVSPEQDHSGWYTDSDDDE